MTLDGHEKISIAEIVFYTPTLLHSLYLSTRYGFRREAGWIFLLIFAVVRIIGASVRLSAELNNPPNTEELVMAFSFEAAGLGPLLMCTTSLLGIVAQHTANPLPLSNKWYYRVLRLLILASFVLAIVGGSEAISGEVAVHKSTGPVLRKVSSVLILVSYVTIVVIQSIYWLNKDLILRHRKALLAGISVALPFLAVRITYAVVSSFSHPPSKFDMMVGSWEVFLVMSVVMECVIVSIYLTCGGVIQLESDSEYDKEEGEGKTEKE